jgi:hypothetical protein
MKMQVKRLNQSIYLRFYLRSGSTSNVHVTSVTIRAFNSFQPVTKAPTAFGKWNAVSSLGSGAQALAFVVREQGSAQQFVLNALRPDP